MNYYWHLFLVPLCNYWQLFLGPSCNEPFDSYSWDLHAMTFYWLFFMASVSCRHSSNCSDCSMYVVRQMAIVMAETYRIEMNSNVCVYRLFCGFSVQIDIKLTPSGPKFPSPIHYLASSSCQVNTHDHGLTVNWYSCNSDPWRMLYII